MIKIQDNTVLSTEDIELKDDNNKCVKYYMKHLKLFFLCKYWTLIRDQRTMYVWKN